MFWNSTDDKALVEYIRTQGFCTRRNLCLRFSQNQYQMGKILIRLSEDGKIIEETIGIEKVWKCIESVQDVKDVEE